MPVPLRKTLRVLIAANDDADFCAVQALLAADSHTHYEVARTSSGAAGIERAQKSPTPHEIVVLAAADYDAALEFIRAAAANCMARPLVYIAASFDEGVEAAAVRAGAAECLARDALHPVELGRAIHRSVRHADRRWLELNLLRAGDIEQQRLGAELHDELGQQLAGVAFMAAALRDRLKTSLPHEVAQADALACLARDATQRARSLARGLHPVQFEEHGLVAALDELAAQSQALHGIECGFRRRGSIPVREHSAELHLYRIAQEAIRNAVRHGAVRRIAITLASCGHQHRLTIADDGQGFDPVHASVTLIGRGLRLMEYRATMIAGEFTIRSRPGGGARVACRFASPSLS